MNLALAPLLSASLLCSNMLFAQGSTEGVLEAPQLSAGERVSYALLFPGATHYKLKQESRGALYLGLTSAALLTGVSLVAAGYVKERAYLNADASPMQYREAANSLYERGNHLLWVTAAVWTVSVFDAWLGELSSASCEAVDEDALSTEALLRRPAPLADRPKSAKPITAKPIPAKPVAAQPKPAKPKPTTPVAAKPKPAKPVAVKSKLAKPVAAKPKPAKPIAAKPIAAKAKPAKPVTAKPKPVTKTMAPTQTEDAKVTSTTKMSGAVGKAQEPKSSQASQLMDPFEEPALRAQQRAPETKAKETKAPASLDKSPPKPQEVSKPKEPTEPSKKPGPAPKTTVIVMFDHVPEGRFSLQLRAFKKENVAQRYVSKVAKKVGPVRVFRAMHKGSPLFRVRLGRFKTRAAAELALTKFLRVMPSKGKPIVVSAERK